MEQRRSSYDLLRVISAFMVVILHVSGIIVSNNMQDQNLNFTVANFFDSMSRVCVPIFVMISGTFILDNDKNKDCKFFYKKTLNRIVKPTIIWSLIYCFYNVLIELSRKYNGEYVPISNFVYILKRFIKGEPFYHLWYMFMLIGLYLSVPILVRVKCYIGEKKMFYLSFLLLGLGILINHTSNTFWLFKWTEYIGYFTLGYTLRIYHKNKQNVDPIKFIVIALISSLSIFFITEINVKVHFINDLLYFYGNLTPLVIISSICLFIAFVNIKNISVNVDKIASCTFYIYLVHAMILDIINRSKVGVLSAIVNPIIYIPIISILVFIISYGVSMLIKRIELKKD